MPALASGLDFAATRLGVIMRPEPGQPHEAWGVLNPAGVRAADGTMQLFPRLIAEGRESYEVNAGGGGVEDPRVVYVPLLKRFVMAYTAFVPCEPRVGRCVSTTDGSWPTMPCRRRTGILVTA